jgi:hypothetical protein
MRQWIGPVIFCAAVWIGAAVRAQDVPGASSPSSTDFFAAAAKTDALLASSEPLLADQYTADPYQTAEQPGPQEPQVNNGGAHLGLDFAYMNRYVYRGLDHDLVATHGNSLNLVFEGKLSFDLGSYPHPFVGLFTDIYDADPVSRFQEIRPYAGADWDLRPFDFVVQEISYIYPQREQYNIPEVDARITLDDSLLFNTDEPILSPYVLGAYAYQKEQGWYVETGLKHDFVFEDYGLTITAQSAVAWISGLHQQFVFINTIKSTGWQHFEVGLSASYSLNHLLNVSTRFGEFDVIGFGFYDEKLSANITATDVLWSGVGMAFKY